MLGLDSIDAPAPAPITMPALSPADRVSSAVAVMTEEQRGEYEVKRSLARTAGRLNANLKAEIQVHEGKRDMESRMNRARRPEMLPPAHDLVLGESALEIINLFKKKAEESRLKIQQLKQEVLNAQALTNKYKELYDRTRKQLAGGDNRDADDADNDDSVSRVMNGSHAHSTSDAASMSTSMAGTIANLKKRGVNFEIEFERLQIKHQTLLHETEKLKLEVQRLKTDNQQLISKVRRSEEEQREALNKYSASETSRADLERRLEREKKQHQLLLQTVRKQTAEWLGEQRQLQQIDEEDKWNSIIPAEDRQMIRSKTMVNPDTRGPGSVVSHATGFSNRGSDKTNTRSVSQRKA